jgi:tRNA dimethylallyltransferase
LNCSKCESTRASYALYNYGVVTNKLPHLIAIFGPTAAGKSALAISVSEELGGEIVSADSRQVYRYMDIGTDKPGTEEQARIPHHMIDLVDPDESFTLALYQEQAYVAIDDILSRGRLPVLVGGTPLYINSVIEGWNIPRVEPDLILRAALEAEALMNGPATLYSRLKEIDPQAARNILPTNSRRIIRALEVIKQTGQAISAQQTKQPPPYNILPIRLECERSVLYKRIDDRVDNYIARGLVEEVEALHSMGYSFDLPSMSGIGYRQIGDYLQGLATLADAIQRTKWDTHAFVRHQGNWFRRKGDAHTFDVTYFPATEAALSLARNWLAVAHRQSGDV